MWLATSSNAIEASSQHLQELSLAAAQLQYPRPISFTSRTQTPSALRLHPAPLGVPSWGQPHGSHQPTALPASPQPAPRSERFTAQQTQTIPQVNFEMEQTLPSPTAAALPSRLRTAGSLIEQSTDSRCGLSSGARGCCESL